jgi:hypothetical protein
MTEEQNTLEEHPVEEISGLSLNAIAGLLHSEEIKSHSFTRPLENGGGELAECVVGQQAEDGHTLLSTYGAGGVPTEGKINIDNIKEYEYHAEFFMVASSVPVANVLVEELVNISFIVSVNRQPLFPGMVIGGVNGNDEIFYLFTERPLGIQNGHGHPPILTPDFALAFVAVNRLYKEEVDLIQAEGGFDKFSEFLTSLGNDAYSISRPKYSDVAVTE